MSKNFQFVAKAISLGEESNDIYMSIQMVFLTSETNLNYVKFTPEFINQVVAQKEKYIGIPLVVDLGQLMESNYKSLGHKFYDGKFHTTAIGSFVDFSVRDNNGVTELLASARVWKRFPEVCSALNELYFSDAGLQFSYEILVSKYNSINNVKVIDVDGGNLIGSCVVSFPAVPASRCELLVAELFGAKDEKDKKGCGTEVKIEIDDESEEEDEEEDDEEMCAKKSKKGCGSSSANTKKEDSKMDVKNTVAEIQDLKNFEVELTNALTEVANLKSSLTGKDNELAEKDELVKEKETEIATLNETIAKLAEEINTKSAEIASLIPFKVKIEQAEAEAQERQRLENVKTLKEQVLKALDEKFFPEIAESVEALDYNKVYAFIAEKVIENNGKVEKSKTMFASRITDSNPIADNDVVSRMITLGK